MDSLTGKVKTGTQWVILERVLIRAIAFIRIPILARLLSPDDFGLLGIITTILLFIDVFTRTGFQAALIQKSGQIDKYLDVGWSLTFLKGIVEALILLLLLRQIAIFYDEPILSQLFIIVIFARVIDSLVSIRQVELIRDLNLRPITIFNLVTTTLSTLVVVALAYYYRNVWALVLGVLSTSIFNFIGSYIIAPYRPKLDFNLPKAKELWLFGRWELAAGIMITIFMHGDDLFVGKYLGLVALGFYSMAYNIGNIITTEMVDSLRKVFFPAFSSIQSEIPRLRKSYLTIYNVTAVIGGLFCLGLFLLAPQLVVILLGEKWTPMIPTLRVLALWGGLQMLSTSVAPLFRSVNRPDFWAKIQVIKVVILLVLIFPLSLQWNIAGTAMAVLIAAALEIPFGMRWVKKSIQCSWSDLIKPLIIPLSASCVITIIYYSILQVFEMSDLIQLIVFIPLITIAYMFFTYVLDSKFNFGLRQLFRKVISI